MAIKLNEREYRNMSFEIREGQPENEEPSYKVEGYASTYEPYLLWEDDDIKLYERIAPEAFKEADLSDVVFLYNHEGMVYARQRNNTLDVSVDDKGLKTVADLGSTEMSRQMFEQIRSGLIDQMSFAFTVTEDELINGEGNECTRVIKRIGKVYDVSAVSIPANPDTDISAVSARDYAHGVMDIRKAERLEREKQLEVLKLKLSLIG